MLMWATCANKAILFGRTIASKAKMLPRIERVPQRHGNGYREWGAQMPSTRSKCPMCLGKAFETMSGTSAPQRRWSRRGFRAARGLMRAPSPETLWPTEAIYSFQLRSRHSAHSNICITAPVSVSTMTRTSRSFAEQR
jgi:hypothetical protein